MFTSVRAQHASKSLAGQVVRVVLAVVLMLSFSVAPNISWAEPENQQAQEQSAPSGQAGSQGQVSQPSQTQDQPQSQQNNSLVVNDKPVVGNTSGGASNGSSGGVTSGITDEDSDEEEVTLSAEEAEKNDLANSFRYEDGELALSAEAQGPQRLRLNSIMPQAATSSSPVAKGIDVSYHQGNINWTQVKNSGQVDFVIIRCGYGSNTKAQDDKQWLNYVKECQRLGIPFGVYLYSYATDVNKASSEADHALRCLKEAGLSPSKVAYPVYYDMEDTVLPKNKNTLASMAKTFCNKIAAAGYTPGVYANTNWWTNYLTDSSFDQYERWVAQYNTRCTYTGDYRIWQYSSSGSVPGISGRVDMNYDYGVAGPIKDVYSNPDTAYAQTLAPGEYYFTTPLNNYSVMDIKGGSTADGGNLQLYAVNKSAAQRFKVERDSSTGYYTITNINSGKALGLQTERNSTYSLNVAQYTKDANNNAQKWIIDKNSDGSYQLKPAVNPNYAIGAANNSAANGSNLRLYTVNTSAAQKFKASSTTITLRDKSSIDGTVFTIKSTLNANKVLDVKNGSTASGAAIQLYDSNNSQAQRFRLERTNDGFYYIVNVRSGMVLDVQGGGLADGAKVQQYTKTGSDNQQWVLVNNGDGNYSFQSKSNGLMLDVTSANTANGTLLQTYTANGSSAQKFFMDNKTNANKTIESGTYTIRSKKNSGFVLDVKSGSTKNSANIQLYSSNETLAQTFSVRYDVNTGYYTIQNLKSGKVLDAKNGKAGNGVNVQQYQGNGTLAQKWLITGDANSGYRIQSAINTNYQLDIAAGRIRNSSNIQLYQANTTDAQKFTFQSAVALRTIEDGTYIIHSAINSRYVLDVRGGSSNNKANVQLYENNGTDAQKFNVKYDASTGFYTLENVKSKRILDVSGASMRNRGNVWQYDNNGTYAQKWIIVRNPDNTYTFKAAIDPSFRLDVSGGVAANSRNVQIYKQNGSPAQKFTFEVPVPTKTTN